MGDLVGTGRRIGVGRLEAGCAEARVGSHEGDPAIWSRPGWRCDVEVRVANRSGREVRVTDVTARMVGLDSRLEARALPTDTAPVGQASPSTDARWEVDVTVPAHASRIVTVAIGWRQDGCNSGGYVSTEPVGDRALRGARAGAPGHGPGSPWCCARSTSDATGGCVRRSRCAGPGAPHGAWPLVAA